jgi:Phage P22-like portal protein
MAEPVTMKEPGMDNDAILSLARSRMDEAYTADQPHRERAEDDLRNVIGDQWPEEERLDREADNRPCLTINILAQNVRQVTGQIRSLNPAIKVTAADSAANKDTAEVIEGMIRHIENKSDASSVYEAATEQAAASSIGYWRIRADYADGDTFDQELKVERVYNPFSVFLDPFAKDPTRKDARYGFVVEEMPKEEFEAQYPDATVSAITSDHKLPNFEQWMTADAVTVAEYFWVDHKEHEIALLPSGQVIRGPFPEGVELKRKRTVKTPQVMWAKITGADVLEGPQEFPCSYIPIVAVTGEEWHLGEETYRSSVIRHAKEPQRLFNYAASTDAEVTAMQPKAPYLVSTKQIAGLEDFWAEMGVRNRPYLPYNPDPDAGMPSRVPPPVASQALQLQMQMAAENIKRTTGIYDASLGARSNETSGRAILARKEESQNATSIYADNMVKAITHTGCILVDMIPRIYDTQRIVRVLGEDGQEKMETINQLVMTAQGPMAYNDMTAGRYDVNVSVGPSYSAKREETQQGLQALLQAVPQAATVLADLYVSTMEWEHADRAAERLRKMLPPGVAEESDEEMTPEQMQAKQMAMQQAQQDAAMQQDAMAIQKRGAEAEAAEKEAKARKANAEAEIMEFELQTKTGAVRQLVEGAVAQTAQAMTLRQAGM